MASVAPPQSIAVLDVRAPATTSPQRRSAARRSSARSAAAPPPGSVVKAPSTAARGARAPAIGCPPQQSATPTSRVSKAAAPSLVIVVMERIVSLIIIENESQATSADVKIQKVCSAENCVNNCKSKADCDPGSYGKEYVLFDKCPLNVCCSKHGFCGTTEEFCGKNKPKRPSCDIDKRGLSRVVGYYEGWAPDRPCHSFYPEQIPRGVYTHLNFAFATIDPNSLEIQPASKSDIELYSRLNTLKLSDPNLRTFIAVGGWTFNDPGPTRTTFSDVARSTENMDKFINSVIKFLQKYDFDGIDLDWEYPRADDRGGREEDFKNFVTLSKRLKSALKTTSRPGYSITVPASFWYLQHFDIKGLEPHVDFFNIMSYDLHGTWDMPNGWTGPYLNAHTNLTELKDGMDLFWRNDISPSKLVFGTGFYGRAFTVADPACKTPGCEYASGAPKQACSREVSVILNNEIMDVMKEMGVKPVLHQEEAVKSLTWGNNWVAYDDEETLAMRADFVREQCLGGIMVWAVSHDTPDGKFSLAVQKAANRPVAIGSSTDGYDEKTTVHDQCKWSNCMEGCPNGWHSVRRGDGGARSGEVMGNNQGCEGYGTRWLCCPPGASGWDGPSCGWWGHNNGKCNHRDTDSAPIFEIGSNSQHCKKKNSYQIAGCTWSSEAVKAHVACPWSWDFPNCDGDEGKCPSGSTELFSSSSGSQGAFCNGDSRRKYCCRDSQKELHWENCEWSENSGIIPSNLKSGTCIGGCPSGKTALALDHKGGSCSKGARARCCDVGYKTLEKKYNDLDEEFDYYLNYFIQEGAECVATSGDSGSMWRAQEYLEQKVKEIVYGTADKSTTDVWKSRIGLKYDHLGIGDIRAFALSNSAAYRLGSARFPKRLICGLTTFDNLIGGHDSLKCACDGAHCCIGKLCERDSKIRRHDSEVAEEVEHFTRHTRGMGRRQEITDSFNETDLAELEDDPIFTTFAGKRSFNINEVDENGLLIALTICKYHASPSPIAIEWLTLVTQYYSIGSVPISSDLWQRSFGYSSQGCWDYDIEQLTGINRNNRPNLVVEHIIELQTIAQFVRSTITGVLRSGDHFEDRVDGRTWSDVANNDYPMGVPPLNGQRQGFQRLFSILGTRTHTAPFVLAPSDLNSAKLNMWQNNEPVSESDLNGYLATGTGASFQSFINMVRIPVVVLQYLTDGTVRTQARAVYRALRDEMRVLLEQTVQAGYRNPSLHHMLDR
ncbi:hypothetical protein KVR01_009081 [Diaporthe batatas]|uniref:uncharacterized protein n=1 Tax=Diaporthe batatas TaxID=748121 RepID=UPI001D040A9E|nr:uncharacterized protein KVR01_009081 [Diaporthe batatas]KAG8160817.1 hypothetical protein KVR01_009081 [Diaporthe batatas]